MNRQTDALRV